MRLIILNDTLDDKKKLKTVNRTGKLSTYLLKTRETHEIPSLADSHNNK